LHARPKEESRPLQRPPHMHWLMACNPHTLGVGALAWLLVASLLAGPSYAPGACPESRRSSRLLMCWQRRLGWPGPSGKGPSSCGCWGRLWLPDLLLARPTCTTAYNCCNGDACLWAYIQHYIVLECLACAASSAAAAGDGLVLPFACSTCFNLPHTLLDLAALPVCAAQGHTAPEVRTTCLPFW
jgi:hypothetical protein